MEHSIWVWLGFYGLVIGLLIVDNFVFNAHPHKVSMRQAWLTTAMWIGVSIVVNVLIYIYFGRDRALEFTAGYLIEKALSVDNLFVFIIIFSYFQTAAEYQHKVLFWGIVGAKVMRTIFILAGASLVSEFHWLLYIFGAFLIWTAYKLWRTKEDTDEENPENNWVVQWCKRHLPFTEQGSDHGAFWYRMPNASRKFFGLMFTPLFLVLITIEITDVLFAFDSIPAIMAISRDPFILISSNILAILGLRALYFILAAILPLFRFLKTGLVVVLGFIGLKMVLGDFYHVPIEWSLGFVVATLVVSVLASKFIPEKPAEV